MVDILTLALTHGLIAIALWRMLSRAELDSEQASERPPRAWHRPQAKSPEDGDA